MRLDGLRRERALASKQYRDGSFHNTHPLGERLAGGSLPIMREFLFGRGKRKPPGVVPVASPLAGWATPVGTSGLRATWLGHSTVLLEIDGLRVITDPVFGDRLGLVSFAGPKRLHAAPVSVAELPQSVWFRRRRLRQRALRAGRPQARWSMLLLLRQWCRRRYSPVPWLLPGP